MIDFILNLIAFALPAAALAFIGWAAWRISLIRMAREWNGKPREAPPLLEAELLPKPACEKDEAEKRADLIRSLVSKASAEDQQSAAYDRLSTAATELYSAALALHESCPEDPSYRSMALVCSSVAGTIHMPHAWSLHLPIFVEASMTVAHRAVADYEALSNQAPS